MKLTVDSPELTAFALGELDPVLAGEVARVVAGDPVLQREVEAIRMTAGDLTAAFSAEPVAVLEPEQRTRVFAEARSVSEDLDLQVAPVARPTRTREPEFHPVPWWTRFWPVAVGFAAVAVVAVIWTRTGRGGGQLARLDEPSNFDQLRYQPGRPATGPSPSPVTNGAPATRPKAQEREQLADRPVVATAPPPPASAPAAPPSRTLVRNAPASGAEPRPDGAVRAERTRVELVAPAPSAAPASTPVSRPARPEPTSTRRYALTGAAPAEELSRQWGYDTAAAGAEPGVLRGLSRANEAKLRESEVRLVEQKDSLAYVPVQPPGVPSAGGEGYAAIQENPFRSVTEAPLSTFGLDVDTASYANVRRFLREGFLPPADAVRLEEMINYFRYADPAPDGEHPVSVSTEMAGCPWAPDHRLLRVAVRSKEIRRAERPPANLVFLVDVSGSMEPENKLPLVKRTLRLLVERLTAKDSVAIVTYAGDAGVALPPTNGGEKAPILKAIEALKSGGSTHGSAGITTAYELASRHLVKDGINRVLLCTDGDFNVGVTSREALLELITEKAKTGVFLSVLGYGMGNYQDATTELLADRGNGNYAYVDSYREAQKVLQEQLESTLVTVARDVKLQLEFNPARVARYRLLGYENRLLADRDFNDDTKDAGEVGAGLSVTALYEIVPVGGDGEGVDPLRYGRSAEPAPKPVHTDEWLLVKLRYQKPEGSPSQLLTRVVKDGGGKFEAASADLRFASAAAGFGMVLRNSAHKGSLTYEQVARLAEGALGEDPGGYRAEMVDLVRRAQELRWRR